jgi:hypothetical protein
MQYQLDAAAGHRSEAGPECLYNNAAARKHVIAFIRIP